MLYSNGATPIIKDVYDYSYMKRCWGQIQKENSYIMVIRLCGTQAGCQFVCIDHDMIIGAFVLNEDPQGKYENTAWRKSLTQGEYMVCHTLAAAPSMQGKGIGKQLVEFCVDYAKSRGYQAIRLDAVPDNIPARKLYEKCGFQYAGDVDLERNIEEIPLFSMYELNF